MSITQNIINSPQAFKASFGILFNFNAVLFERRLIVLAISFVVMSLLTHRQIAGISPMMSLKFAETGWKKSLFVRIFAFSSLLFMACVSFACHKGGMCKFSAGRPAFFFAHFAIAQRPLLWGRLRLVICLFIN